MVITLIPVLFLLAAEEWTESKSITVYMIGDSTMSEKRVENYPETGWGMPFQYYFSENVTVENHARNGRSTRTFLEEGRWEPIMKQIEKGDYVFIQFAHNDEVETKDSYTKPEEFKANLARYVQDTRDKQAKPVLLTPTARRHFDADGQLIDTHKEYSELLREVAHELDVPLIDMDFNSQEMLRELGPDKSRFLYNHLQPGENPHYAEGIEDNTHFNEYGARKMAEIALNGIQEFELDLANYIAD